METRTCKRCGYKWQPRVKNPKHCPSCKSPYWAWPRKRDPRTELEKEESKE